MKKKNLWLVFVLVMVLASFGSSVFAGGWATVTLDSLPETIKAGETARIEFTILQHGKTPVHTLGDIPMTPTVTATLSDTTLEFDAQPLKEPGRWFVDVTLPEAGAWEWAIAPEPLAGTTELEPLVVEAAAVAPTGVEAVNVLPLVIVLALVGLIMTVIVWWRGKETAVGASS